MGWLDRGRLYKTLKRKVNSPLGFGKGAGSQSPPAGNSKNAGAVSLQNYQRFEGDEKSQPGISENTCLIPGSFGGLTNRNLLD